MQIMSNLCLIIAWAGLLTTRAIAQPAAPSVNVTGGVDGATNPAAIPDVVAYRHFLGVIIKSPTQSSTAEEERRRSYVKFFFSKGCGPNQTEDRTLSEAQITALFTFADEVGIKLRAIEAPAGNSAQSFGAARDQAVAEAMQQLATKVDGDASAKIARHVAEHVKAHIKLTTVSMPSKAGK